MERGWTAEKVERREVPKELLEHIKQTSVESLSNEIIEFATIWIRDKPMQTMGRLYYEMSREFWHTKNVPSEWAFYGTDVWDKVRDAKEIARIKILEEWRKKWDEKTEEIIRSLLPKLLEWARKQGISKI